MKIKLIISVAFLLFFCVGAILVKYNFSNQDGGASLDERTQYQRDVQAQNEYHLLLKKADYFLEKKEYSLAEENYLKALKMSEKTSLEGVARGALMRLYEKTGYYEKALSNLEWILKNMQKNMPQYQKYESLKSEYLQKLSESIDGSPSGGD